MSDRLSHTDLLRFAYGEADELEAVILEDPDYMAALEEIWASELPTDLRTPVVRALQLHHFASRTIGAIIDLAISFGKAIPHYMAADIDDQPDPEPKSSQSEPD
jgi:hypothetical protein